MQKRKSRIEQWRAERRSKLGIDKVMQQAVAHSTKSKAWSLEDEGEDEEDPEAQNPQTAASSAELKREIAAARETMIATQIDKRREAAERAAEAAALELAARALAEKVDDDEEDPLDKYMQSIAKDVKSFRGTVAAPAAPVKSNPTIVTTVKQEQQASNGVKASVVKVVTKIVKSEPTESITATKSAANGHRSEPMETDDKSSLGVPSRVSVRSGVAKRAKDKGLIMEQDIDGLEYSSEEEGAKPVEDLDELFSLTNKKSKADMIVTNHEKIYYRPFRKDFYTIVPEIAAMTDLEVAALREELDGIKVVGKRCPRPVKAWAHCITSDKILQSLRKSNYEKPTPIQAQALPIILSGRNMIGIAKTGSGKTLAFVLPIFRHIKDQPPLEGDDGPIAIIMTPTRELALQITKECKKFAKLFNLRCVAVYGGTAISEQIAELKRGVEIIVCTPGRMIDMLAANGGT